MRDVVCCWRLGDSSDSNFSTDTGDEAFDTGGGESMGTMGLGDGDGLFALSWNDAGTPAFLREREVATVLTPHDGEYGTLMGARPGDDRIAAAQSLVDLTGACVVLKGPTTVVAAPGTVPALVTSGDERLATAGTGDVLAGIVAALIAQGLTAADAALAGAFLHGRAVHRCDRYGVVAGDLIDHLPATIADLHEERP